MPTFPKKSARKMADGGAVSAKPFSEWADAPQMDAREGPVGPTKDRAAAGQRRVEKVNTMRDEGKAAGYERQERLTPAEAQGVRRLDLNKR